MARRQRQDKNREKETRGDRTGKTEAHHGLITLPCNDWHVWAIRLCFSWQGKCCWSGCGEMGYRQPTLTTDSIRPATAYRRPHTSPRYPPPRQPGGGSQISPVGTINSSASNILQSPITHQRNVSWLIAQSKHLTQPHAAYEGFSNDPQMRTQGYWNEMVIIILLEDIN